MNTKTREIWEPNYFACRRIVDDLIIFKSLILHHQNSDLNERGAEFWKYQTDIKPLEELVPPLNEDGQTGLEREINKMIPNISRYLSLGSISTGVFAKNTFDHEKGVYVNHTGKGEKYDVIQNYLDDYDAGEDFSRFLIATLDRGIGFFERRKKRAIMEFFNPLHWFAFILRTPIRILELAGVEAPHKIMGKIYYVLMYGLIILGAGKLGLSIPWEKFR